LSAAGITACPNKFTRESVLYEAVMFYSTGPGISRSQVIRDNGHLPIEIRSNLTEVHRDPFFALIEWLSAFSNDKETKEESNAPIKRTPFSVGAVLANIFYEGAKIS
jgi:hypothetical protein